LPLILSRTLCFIAIPCLYFLLGWLNHVQLGKSALLGALAFLALSSWTSRNGKESRSGQFANILVVLLFLLIIAYQAFLRDVFGVAQDDALVMEALFGTNAGETYEFILQNSHAFVKHIALLLGVFALFTFFVFRQFQRPPVTGFFHSGSRRRTLALVLIAIFALIHLNPTMRKENPLLYFPLRYLKWKKNVDAIRFVQTGLASRLNADQSLAGMHYAGHGKRTVIFVLGESSTRLNWSLYGYPRITTPEMQALQHQLLKFTDVVTTCGSTILDMEKILTPATRTEPALFQEQPDILTIARKAGYKTFWITNHGTDMTGLPAIFADNADKTINANRGGSRSEGSYDEVVLPYLREALDDPAPQKFIILHLLNAHPAYYFRYPQTYARFDNVNDTVHEELEKAGRAIWVRAMRDQYDNAILYSDHVLRQSIALCEKHPDQTIAWLYAPDHGEDVAHYSNFVGHNNRVLAMYEIPMLLWRSPTFLSSSVEDEIAAPRPYQTDQLDHTLLGLMQIEGAYYDARRDIMSPAFAPLPRVVAGESYPRPH
jgi:heptose-I-phosphate ethanolaminephosphotransferase